MRVRERDTDREVRNVIGEVRNVLKNITSFAGDDFGLGVDGNCQSALVVVAVAGNWGVIGCGGGVGVGGVEAAEP